MWERLKNEVARIRRWLCDTAVIAAFIAPWIVGVAVLSVRFVGSTELKKQIVYEFVKSYAKEDEE